jgi:hypothetical protein
MMRLLRNVGERRKLLFGAAALLAVAALLPVPAQQSDAAAIDGAVKITKKIGRTHLVDGKNVVADSRTVTLHVDQTKQLRDRQEVIVTWSGAHPSMHKIPDTNSQGAASQEYPFVLMECRGVDSTHVAMAKRLTPQTCWTQTPAERFATSPTLLFPPWRVDRYATRADRKKVVGVPKKLASTCALTGNPEYWLHFRAVDGTDYAGGGDSGCAGTAPEQSIVGSTTALPGNTTYGFTDADGTGQAKFAVWTSLTNASLGCGPAVPCSLVAIPIEGISCDVAATGLPADNENVTAAETACTTDGGQTQPSLAVMGRLWWSASNWRNRITIPLSFAPLPTTECTTSSGNPGIQIYGSELMTAATLQWDSKFCEDPSLFPVTHVQTGETQARNLVDTGSVEGAFTSLAPPGGYNKPVVSAPVAMTGFGVGYAIDDADGHEYSSLRLTPRLLAKLLTESYPAVQAVQQGWADTPNAAEKTDYKPLANNPMNIAADPEFIALNPGLSHDPPQTFGASTLLMLSSSSDIVEALTSYINADPQARAWLDGAPDPWGMVVNPHYKSIKLPVDNWPLLDTYEPTSIYNGTNPCLEQNPVPYLPLVASPMNTLSLISLNLQYAIQQSQVVCTGADTLNPKLVAVGPEPIGSRFIIGITSLADVLRYRINTAALQTRPDHFVAPADAGLRGAARLLTPNSDDGTWELPYGQLVGASGDSNAYPGAMLISAAIPTKGLAKTDAANYARYLAFAAGAGQTHGGNAGQLPDGYLPLSAANGLGAQSRYTTIAAQYVAAQNGRVPDLTSPKPVPSAHSSSSPTPTPSSSAPQPSGGGTGGGPLPGGGGATTPAGGVVSPSSPATSPGAAASAAPPAPTVRLAGKDAPSAGGLGVILPILALIGLGAGLAAPVLTRLAGRRT